MDKPLSKEDFYWGTINGTKLFIPIMKSESNNEPLPFCLLNDVPSNILANFSSSIDDFQTCLDLLNLASDYDEKSPDNHHYSSSFFQRAIVLYIKQFNKSNSRVGLIDSTKVYRNNANFLREHLHLKDMRNKYLAHRDISKFEHNAVFVFKENGKYYYQVSNQIMLSEPPKYKLYIEMIKVCIEHMRRKVEGFKPTFLKHLNSLNEKGQLEFDHPRLP